MNPAEPLSSTASELNNPLSASHPHRPSNRTSSRQALNRSSALPAQENGYDPKFLRRKEEQRLRPLLPRLMGPLHELSSAVAAPDRETGALANARIDWRETPEARIFQVDLLGLKKEEVKVEVEDGRVLQISGERRREQEDKKDKWHHVERSIGKFVRRFGLPKNVKLDEVRLRATMQNGVLNIVVPKFEEKKHMVKPIDISG